MKTTLRKELETLVVSTNKVLKEVVAEMDTVILLRNSHPLYRADMALGLYRDGRITQKECSEFTDPRGLKKY